MDPTEYHGKGNNQKTTSPSWEENVQAELSHTSMKIPLDLEHSKLEVTSPASSAGPPLLEQVLVEVNDRSGSSGTGSSSWAEVVEVEGAEACSRHSNSRSSSAPEVELPLNKWYLAQEKLGHKKIANTKDPEQNSSKWLGVSQATCKGIPKDTLEHIKTKDIPRII